MTLAKIWIDKVTSIGLSEVDFNKVTFLVQVHDLGYEKSSSGNARKVGDKIGKCI